MSLKAALKLKYGIAIKFSMATHNSHISRDKSSAASETFMKYTDLNFRTHFSILKHISWCDRFLDATQKLLERIDWNCAYISLKILRIDLH